MRIVLFYKKLYDLICLQNAKVRLNIIRNRRVQVDLSLNAKRMKAHRLIVKAKSCDKGYLDIEQLDHTSHLHYPGFDLQISHYVPRSSACSYVSLVSVVKTASHDFWFQRATGYSYIRLLHSVECALTLLFLRTKRSL